ncbi:hypothetical protein Hanom_Chr16g01498921 [Helianthus anomalus]
MRILPNTPYFQRISTRIFCILITIFRVTFRYFSSSFFSVFFAKVLHLAMASRTRSQTADSVPTFNEKNLLKEHKKEVWSFKNADIVALKASGSFLAGAVIRPFNQEVRSDVYSDEWVCFLAFSR